MSDEFHKTERELLVKTTMQRAAARKNAPGFPEALAVSNSILIPVVPHILDIIVILENIEHLFHVGDILGVLELLIVLRHHFDLRRLELVAPWQRR